MSHLFTNRRFKALVLWCGLWQLSHLLLNVNTAFLGATDFPPPPPQGWAPQAHSIFDGMVAADLVQAALCLVFVGGYFARRSWCSRSASFAWEAQRSTASRSRTSSWAPGPGRATPPSTGRSRCSGRRC